VWGEGLRLGIGVRVSGVNKGKGLRVGIRGKGLMVEERVKGGNKGVGEKC
jgi:hypothetical protein